MKDYFLIGLVIFLGFAQGLFTVFMFALDFDPTVNIMVEPLIFLISGFVTPLVLVVIWVSQHIGSEYKYKPQYWLLYFVAYLVTDFSFQLPIVF